MNRRPILRWTLLSVAITSLVVWAVAQEAARQAEGNKANFHHVRLNVVDPQKSINFYTRVMGGVAVDYRGKTPASFNERSFFLFNKVDQPAPSELTTTIYHIGWGAVDGDTIADWLRKNNVAFHTEPTPLGDNKYLYFYGPDRELIEFWTGYKNHRFGHVHFFSDDIDKATAWYQEHLGLRPRSPKAFPFPNVQGLTMNGIQADNVDMIFFSSPRDAALQSFFKEAPIPEHKPTEGQVINHLAFAYADIDPVFERMKAAGVEIVKEIAEDPTYGHRSFYVRGPDKVLIEIVEDKPIPSGIW